MSTSQLKFPFVSENLQRWDAADQSLLTDYTSALVRECLKDVAVGDALGRVFKGFQPVVNVPSKTVTLSGEGVAVDKDGNLLVATSSFSEIPSLAGLAANKQFYVFAYAKPVIDTVNKADRKIWNTGTSTETQSSVPVFKNSVVKVVVSDAYTITPNNVSGCPVSYVDPFDGLSYTTLPLASFNTDGSSGITAFRDIRKMFAIDGNAVAGVTGLETELPHNFTPADPKTQGVTSVRMAIRSLASVISKIIGNDVEENVWYNDPVIGLNQFRDEYVALLGTTGTGVRRVRTVTDASALTALTGSVDKDVAYSQAQNSLYEYSSSSSAVVAGIRVVSGNGGIGRWFLHNNGATDTAYGFPGLGSDGALSKTDVVKTANLQAGAVTGGKVAADTLPAATLTPEARASTFVLSATSSGTGWSGPTVSKCNFNATGSSVATVTLNTQSGQPARLVSIDVTFTSLGKAHLHNLMLIHLPRFLFCDLGGTFTKYSVNPAIEPRSDIDGWGRNGVYSDGFRIKFYGFDGGESWLDAAVSVGNVYIPALAMAET